MDYQQLMYGRSSYDPARAPHRLQPGRGIGGMTIVVGAIVAALAIAIWFAGMRDVADPSTTSPAMTADSVARALPSDPATGTGGATATTPAGN